MPQSTFHFLGCTSVFFCAFIFCDGQAFRKFDEIAAKLTEQLRKLTKQVKHLLPDKAGPLGKAVMQFLALPAPFFGLAGFSWWPSVVL